MLVLYIFKSKKTDNNMNNMNRDNLNITSNVSNASNASDASNLSIKGSNASHMSSLSSQSNNNPNYKDNNMNVNNLNNENMASNASNEQIEITIMDGESNKKDDVLSQSDPYVKIYYGNEVQQTKTQNNKQHPIWNEKFTFKNDFQDIKFELIDDDILKDDKMGIGFIDKNELIQLNSNINKDLNIPLYLNNSSNQIGSLHVQIRLMDNHNNNNNNYTAINEQQYNARPSMVNEDMNININRKPSSLSHDSSSNIESYESERSIHKLPSIQVQTQPTIIEKEIIYEKPIEIQSKIIHREKPIIIEQPIIKEKYEHYRESTEIINNEQEQIHKKYDTSYHDINEENIINNLKQERLSQYQDTSPIIKKEQEIISLNPQIEQQPIQVYENENIFEQPIEIEKKHIEHIKPKVDTNLIYEENHLYEKEQPQIIQNNAETKMMDEYYGSKDMNNMNMSRNEEFVLRIIGAQSNKKEDLLSKSDMYVIIKNGQQSWKTKTIKNSNNPIWNEEFRIKFVDQQPIELILMDNDVIKDDEMSRCIINKQNIMNNNQKDLNLPLLKKNNSQAIGYLHIQIECLSNQQQYSNQSQRQSESQNQFRNENQNQYQSQNQNQAYNTSHRGSGSSLSSSDSSSAYNYASGGYEHGHIQDHSHEHLQHDQNYNKMNANQKNCFNYFKCRRIKKIRCCKQI